MFFVLFKWVLRILEWFSKNFRVYPFLFLRLFSRVLQIFQFLIVLLVNVLCFVPLPSPRFFKLVFYAGFMCFLFWLRFRGLQIF